MKKFKLNVGTKSVLFGAHCFLIHPFFVLAAWWKLYGFPWDPRLWIAFFVHDLGYFGKPNMDGPEGETHVELGAKILSVFDYRFRLIKTKSIHKDYLLWLDGYKLLKDVGKFSLLYKSTKRWHDFSLYHSRFYAKKDNVNYSRLCVADKLAICLEPAWLYLPRVNWSGEVHEYIKLGENGNGKYNSMELNTENQKKWFASVCDYLTRWVEEHKDGKEDNWTPSQNLAETAVKELPKFCTCEQPAKVKGRNQCWRCKCPFEKVPFIL